MILPRLTSDSVVSSYWLCLCIMASWSRERSWARHGQRPWIWHRHLLCRAAAELWSGAQHGTHGESGSQMYSQGYRLREHATSCINVCAVSCGAVSRPVRSTNLCECLLPVLQRQDFVPCRLRPSQSSDQDVSSSLDDPALHWEKQLC